MDKETKKPKCNTCGDTGEVPKPMPAEPHPCNYVNLKRAERTIPCPDCQQPKDQQPSSEKEYSNSEFIEVQRKAAQLAIDAYEEDQEWCPTKTSRLLDACSRLERVVQQRKDLLEACKKNEKILNICAKVFLGIGEPPDSEEFANAILDNKAAIAKAEKGSQ